MAPKKNQKRAKPQNHNPKKSKESDEFRLATKEELEEEARQPPNLSKLQRTKETSGYESEDSSGNEADLDGSGLFADEEEEGTERGDQNVKHSELINEVHLDKNDKGTEGTEDPIQAEFSNCILKCKSVYKCRLCPRIVCLSEDTVKTHLHSKRHARSKKLLGEGRLKLMLNSDGEIEEDLETHAERHSRILALAQEPVAPVKKDSGRQRQNQRRKKRLLRNGSNNKTEKSEDTTNPKKKNRKN